MFPDEKAFFKQLEAKKLALEILIISAKSSANAVELDQTKIGRLSRMDAIQRQAMAIETERRRKLDLRRLEGRYRAFKKREFWLLYSLR